MEITSKIRKEPGGLILYSHKSGNDKDYGIAEKHAWKYFKWKKQGITLHLYNHVKLRSEYNWGCEWFFSHVDLSFY